ncbi:Sugar kinase of the NBD/HSP70 family, may contain an N-terminal HTH domain [Cryobacterium flavum]|uniref:ROK family transcriptional regulator n=1 Tax=Cryobacterium flavum TaxID=1424659 RepID=A0A4V3I9Y3_9MICO|nr:ROK family transcriptional regulator [Cryobacterium flavum]TFB81068.1 ROK family transcriptional regulator [Cryobacterium flavum]SDM77710.1 Sugar kinase of the NBD/HSP70 family, may contain an N-terminal HTH domain [Cryobacterium flavum]
MALHEREMLAFRRRNSAACIGALRDHGVLTVSELASLTGLSRPTVESIVAEFETNGLVTHEQQTTTAAKGRPARRVAFNASAGYVAGLDLGLHRVTVLVSDLAGTIVATALHDITTDITGSELLALAAATLKRALAELDASRLTAVTVCISGIVDASGRVLQSNVLPEWSGLDLAASLSEQLGCQVSVENDVNMAALGELHAGAAQNADDVVFIMVGHRVSAAIILGGALHRGRNFAAGEVGDLESTGWGYQDVHETSVLGAFLGQSPEDVFAAAQVGDPDALELVTRFARRIIRGIAVVGLTVDPDLIVIGGGLSAGPVLLGALQTELALLVTRSTQPPLVSSALGRTGVALGGLVRALEVVSERLYGAKDIAVPRFSLPAIPVTEADAEAARPESARPDPTTFGARLATHAASANGSSSNANTGTATHPHS